VAVDGKSVPFFKTGKEGAKRVQQAGAVSESLPMSIRFSW
jgi:hypothetical protein